MAGFEVTIYHDVAFGDVGSNFIEVRENWSLSRWIFRYCLNDSYNLNQLGK